MRAVVQRVDRASVSVGGEVVGKIEKGLLVYLGAGAGDTETDMLYMVEKVSGLRIFEDAEGKMNLSPLEIGGSILVISQFTLYGDCRKGKRPSFTEAMPPSPANELYERFVKALAAKGLNVQAGKFQAEMKVESINDGPVTILLDSKKQF